MSEKTILIVEDDPKSLKLFRDILQDRGYKVIEAKDASEAILAAKEKKPDLILMDIQLPGMSGLEATGILKSNPSTRDITIIAVTAFAMKVDKEKALAAGCDGYMAKPIDTRKFCKEVESYLR